MVDPGLRVPQRLILFERWMDNTKWILEHTQRFPKRLRHTLTERLERTCLEILEGLTTAAFSRQRAASLTQVDDALNRLRVLVRLTHELRLWSEGQYEECMRRVEETGRMLGGWKKSIADSGLGNTD